MNMRHCRLCHADRLRPVIDLGAMPIAHRMLREHDESEERFPFAVTVCEACGLPQIAEPIDPDILYRDFNFNFSSWKVEPHEPDELDTIHSFHKPAKVFEIGCNDGRFMDELRKRGAKVLFGVEPNSVSSEIARKRGIEVHHDMVSPAITQGAVAKHGKFDLVVSRQVLEHIGDFENFFACVDIALADDGYLFLAVPDFAPGRAAGDVSVLWEEHVNYFTEETLLALLARKGFEPLSVKKYNFSGGSLAVTARRSKLKSPSFDGRASADAAEQFGKRARDYGRRLVPALSRLRDKGTQIVMYGAGCRACTFANTFELGGLIDFAIDDQKERQGLFMPGSRIVIRSPDELKKPSSPLVCLLAVNNENEAEVSAKLKDMLERPLTIVSIFAPADIWRELDRLEAL
jgi:SAM-dependent methyltransferase